MNEDAVAVGAAAIAADCEPGTHPAPGPWERHVARVVIRALTAAGWLRRHPHPSQQQAHSAPRERTLQ